MCSLTPKLSGGAKPRPLECLVRFMRAETEVIVKLMSMDSVVGVMFGRFGWTRHFKLSVMRPLPEQFQNDPEIVAAYTRGKALTLERNRRFGSRDSGGKAQVAKEPE